MYILRLILGSFVAAAPLTWAAITYYPTADFIQYVPMAIGLGVGALAILTAISFLKEGELHEQGKTYLMAGYLLAVMATTLFIGGAYVHQYQTSWTNGEVHWHADFEVLVEESEGNYSVLDLINPGEFCKSTDNTGSSYMCIINDRTGETEYHEHNDMRIHLEGTFRQREDATLSAFFETFGGELSNDRLVFPTEEKVYDLRSDGKTVKIAVQQGVGGSRRWCMIGSGVPTEDICRDPHNGELARSPAEYVISPYQRGPPLDDIMIIYDDASPQEVLQDLRKDDAYKGYKVTVGSVSSSEGY